MPQAASAEPTVAITIDSRDKGRVFEGIGAVSAGASTRNFVDYPSPQRAQVLDYLFKPKFGAALQHLKVEIGGGENSTCGSEPSHVVTRDELEAPKPRGYEFWLMAEARKRNPGILLDCLPWCYPRWISDRFSQDSADWIAAFLEVAKKDYGLELNWIAAAQNEMGTDLDWIVKTLHPTLDAKGFASVKLQAPDDAKKYWEIFDGFRKNPEAERVIAAVGYHYISGWLPKIEDDRHAATPLAIQSGKPLWASEDFSYSGATWEKALLLAQLVNKFYIGSRITKTEIWGPVDGIYAGLPFDGTGLMQAATPWSGNYEVWPTIWTAAHTTQFADPGWIYMDAACGKIDPSTWKGSYVALRNPKTNDWSLIVCTDKPVTFDVKIAGALGSGPVHVWKSNAAEQFIEQPAIVPKNGKFTITLEGDSVYSLTSTTGQQKGAFPPPPAAKPFPFPYAENFENYKAGQTPKYFSDQKGTFETAQRADSKGISLRQIVPAEGILWLRNFRTPYTVFGDGTWTDYTISSDVLVTKGSAEIGGRFRFEGNRDTVNDSLVLNQDGTWSLVARSNVDATEKGEKKKKKVRKPVDTVVAKGRIEGFKSGAWHRLSLRFSGKKMTASIDGKEVGSGKSASAKGMACLASSYDSNEFDNVSIEK